MSAADLAAAKECAHYLVNDFDVGRDEGLVITFNDVVTIVQSMTGDTALLHAAVRGISSSGGSAGTTPRCPWRRTTISGCG